MSRFLCWRPALLLALALLSMPAQAEPVTTRLGILEVDHGLPTPATRQKLYDELDFQRAVQGVIWAEPAINNALMRIYRPGPSVLDGSYKLPSAVAAR
jgi:hypothetical protein